MLEPSSSMGAEDPFPHSRQTVVCCSAPSSPVSEKTCGLPVLYAARVAPCLKRETWSVGRRGRPLLRSVSGGRPLLKVLVGHDALNLQRSPVRAATAPAHWSS